MQRKDIHIDKKKMKTIEEGSIFVFIFVLFPKFHSQNYYYFPLSIYV